MKKSLIEIGNQNALLEFIVSTSDDSVRTEEGNVVFRNIEHVQDLFAAVNASNCEPVYQIEIGNLNWVDVTKTVYYAHPKSKRIIYAAPQSLPPEWAEYVTRLETASKALIARWDSPNWADTRHTADYIFCMRRALEAKPKDK